MELFLSGRIGFMDIWRVVDRVLEEHTPSPSLGLEEILGADQWGRTRATEVAATLSGVGTKPASPSSRTL